MNDIVMICVSIFFVFVMCVIGEVFDMMVEILIEEV